jgi:hypothetical protein
MSRIGVSDILEGGFGERSGGRVNLGEGCRGEGGGGAQVEEHAIIAAGAAAGAAGATTAATLGTTNMERYMGPTAKARTSDTSQRFPAATAFDTRPPTSAGAATTAVGETMATSEIQ